MSWGATGDERYFMWVYPIVLVMVGHVMERHLDVLRNWSALVVLIVFEAMGVRALFPIVDPAQPKIQKPIIIEALAHYLPDGWHFTEMHANIADPKTVLTIVCMNFLMGWILWLFMRRRAVTSPDGAS